jgi:hypothetical protein
MEFNKFIEKYFDPNDDSGFNEIIFQRQAKYKGIKERLKGYYLTDKEIEELFKIITKAEMDMEAIKRKFNGEKYKAKDLVAFEKKLIDIQNKMKTDFDNKLNKILKEKYEKAKKLKAKFDEIDAKKQQ